MTDDELSAACLLRDATDDCGSCFVRSWGGEYEVNVQPDTVVRWHRAGFRLLALEVASPGGPSRDSIGVCQLIRESIEKSIVGSDENQHQRCSILYVAPTGFNLRQMGYWGSPVRRAGRFGGFASSR